MFRRSATTAALTLALTTLAWGAAPASGQEKHAPHTAAPFAGVWEVTFASQMGEMTWTLDLVLEAGQLDGSTETEMGSAPVEGVQDGDQVEFTIYLEAPDHAVDLAFVGTVEGDEAAGVVDIMGEPFDWYATKVDPASSE